MAAAKRITLTVDGRPHRITADPEMPLLYALRNNIGLSNPHFGCGLAQCGACTVHVNGKATRSCAFPVGEAQGKKVVTLAGLGTPEKPHPVQKAFVDEQVSQCGYCVNGWIMTAAELLAKNPKADDKQIREGLAGLKCRCGTHMAIIRAVKRAAREMSA
jgi:aerobic-type carbon monoxide dehydrogenase small subunit (CoxS/CutS family)